VPVSDRLDRTSGPAATGWRRPTFPVFSSASSSPVTLSSQHGAMVCAARWRTTGGMSTSELRLGVLSDE
jgi:hypothetical protein